MSKHFAAGFDTKNLYVCFNDQEQCKFITYAKSDLRIPLEVEYLDLSTDVVTAVSAKGVAVLPDRLLRGRIGERLALYREVVEFHALTKDPATQLVNQQDFIRSFSNERHQLARALPTILSDSELRSKNGTFDFPAEIQSFAQAVYTRAPNLGPTTITEQSINTSSTELPQSPAIAQEKGEIVSVKPWFDLDAHEVYLSYTQVEGVGEKLILLDKNGIADPVLLEKMNFIQPNWSPEFDSNVYFLNSENRSVSRSALATALQIENCGIVKKNPTELETQFQTQLNQILINNKIRVMKDSIFIGTNRANDKVYQRGDNSRWIQTDGGQCLRATEDQLAPHVALYGFDNLIDRNLDLVQTEASLFSIFKEHLDGNVTSGKKTYADHAQILFDTKDPTGEEIHFLGEVYEGVMNKALSNLYEKSRENYSEEAVFNRLISIYQNQPKKTVKSLETLQGGQYSTPVPMSFVAQKLLLGNDQPAAGYQVLEPTIGNGSLVNNLPNAAIYGVELDQDRLAIARLDPSIQVENGDANKVDFKTLFKQPEGFDYVIANPPFGKLEWSEKFDDVLKVSKLDHAIALKALAARKDHGRTVLILNTDGIYSKGEAEGSSKYLINYLSSHYEYLGGIELDSALYVRNGANTNVRMVVIGNRLDEPIKDDKLGEKLGHTKFTICKSYEDLYNWSNNLIEKYPSINVEYAKLKNPEAEVTFSQVSATPLDLDSEIPIVVQEEVQSVNDNSEPVAEPLVLTSVSEGIYDEIGPEDVAEVEFLNISMELFDPTDINNQSITDPHPPIKPRLSTGNIVDDTEKTAISTSGLIIELPIDNESNQGLILDRTITPAYISQEVSSPRQDNDYQAPYSAKSSISNPTSMIPINMSAATYAALDNVESRILDLNIINADGDPITTIDEYVGHRLQYTQDQLKEYFSPEQIDAIALAIDNYEDNRGIINADQTGMGKGRFVAAMMRFAKLEGATPIFMTYKPALFTDIYRDINDIGSLDMFKKAFTLNNVGIRRFDDPEKNLVKSMKAIEHKAFIDSKRLPDGTDFVLGTYSQLAKDYEQSPKSQFLTALTKEKNTKTMVFLDESHLAAGESFTGANVQRVIEHADSVIYSSATPLKQVKHFGLYSRVFPASIEIDRLPDTLEVGGEALQEAISTAMAQDGVLVRREHDFSELIFASLEPDAETESSNRDVADAVAHVLSQMARLSADVSNDTLKMNKQFSADFDKLPDSAKTGNRLKASSMNFGSRMYQINRQFLLGNKIEMVADHVVAEVKAGRKPVIGVESTAASLLDQLIESKALHTDELRELEDLRSIENPSDEKAQRMKELNKHISESAKEMVFEEPPQFKDYLNLMLKKLGVITVRDGYGSVSKVSMNDDPTFIKIQNDIKEQIDELPLIPLIPLDIVREKLKEHGMSMCEISGRTKSGDRYLQKSTIEVKKDGQSTLKECWTVAQFPITDHAEEIGKFQNGTYDVAIVTRSGSTGYSLHATNKYENSDCRQRNFIGLEKAANIAEHLQWIGRVNRKGQVIAPIITNVESGLPAERRLTMMHNAKLRKLSANTTSNRDNSNMENEVDLLNQVGDEIALKFLYQHSDIAETLGIRIPTDEAEIYEFLKQSNDNQYINRLMGRLVLLPVETQEDVISSLEERFAERVIELEAEGKSPFKVDVYDWQATTLSQQTVDDYNESLSDSSFDVPVSVAKLQFEVKYNPLSQEKIAMAIASGNEKMFTHDWFEKYPELAQGSNLSNFKVMSYEKMMAKAFNSLPAERQTNQFYDTPENLNALNYRLTEKDAHVQDLVSRADFVSKALSYLEPGKPIVTMNELKEEQIGLVTSIKMPRSENNLTALSQYEVKVIYAGQPKVDTTNLATLYVNNKTMAEYNLHVFPQETQVALEQFENLQREYAEKTYTKTATVLKDNLFRAVEMATARNLGNPILYTDENNNRQRAVLLRSWISPEDVLNGPIKLSTKQVKRYVDEYVSANDHQSSADHYPLFTYLATKTTKSLQITALVKPHNVTVKIINPKCAEAKKFLSDSDIFVVKGTTNANSLNLKPYGDNKELSMNIEHDQFIEMLNVLHSKKFLQSMYLHEGDSDLLNLLKQDIKNQMNRENDSIELSL